MCLFKKPPSVTSTEATPSPTDNTTAATTTNSTTDPRYHAASAMEMGTAEGNAHQLSTAENAHELDAPDKLHEMGDLAAEYGAEGDIHVEGDIGANTGGQSDEGHIYPQRDHGKYEDEKGAAIHGEGDEKRRGSTKPIAELEGDVAFPDRQAQGDVQGPQQEGKEGLGKGFVLTD
jgi:hypothetical protein